MKMSQYETVDTLETVSLIENLRAVTDWAERLWLETFGSRDRLEGMLLCIEEAFVNLCHHGYRGRPGPVRLECLKDRSVFIVYRILDWSEAFDITQLSQPDTTSGLGMRPIGGLGVMLMKEMADEVDWRLENDANALSLKFNLNNPE